MESEIQDFWQKNPCGAWLVGDLTAEERREYEEFFERYDAYRYAKEPHILTNLDRIDFRGKRVLEIGLGQGADAEAIVARGGVYSGVDLTEESVKRVKMRVELQGLAYDSITQGSALDLPFEKGSFDIVFSHGVLHHIPEIKKASAEIARVLKPYGELISMLYARRSLNYLVSIALLRRAGLLGLYLSGVQMDGMLGEHLANARRMGIGKYLSMKNFIHANTDGPGNPYSKVYDLKGVREDFPEFEVTKSYQCFMHAPPLKVAWLPLVGSLGWHLWVHMRKR
jgi:SAM-dependent methyltransferase